MPTSLKHLNRIAVALDNGVIQAVFTPGGGHLAALRSSDSPTNPLWEPPWPSIEPDERRDPEIYGSDLESHLLASILGHNLCLDLFGGPSPEEARAGYGVHGEAPVSNWHVESGAGQPRETDGLTLRTFLPRAQMDVVRRAWLIAGSPVLHIRETVTNKLSFDRPFGWCQHVTLGPPFLETGQTFFDAGVTRGKVFPLDLGGHDLLQPGAEFTWPQAPQRDGKTADLRTYPRQPGTGEFVSLQADPSHEWCWFTALNIRLGLVLGYLWKRTDFPWLGIWEENHSRTIKPWSGRTLTRGMEFSNQPMPANKREMVRHSPMLGEPALAWLAAKTTVHTEYAAWVGQLPVTARSVRKVRLQAQELRMEFDCGSVWTAPCGLSIPDEWVPIKIKGS